jgi:hypothetical protein
VEGCIKKQLGPERHFSIYLGTEENKIHGVQTAGLRTFRKHADLQPVKLGKALSAFNYLNTEP